MAELKKEYTDINDVTHKVEHIAAPTDENNKERVIEELYSIFTKAPKQHAKAG